MPATVPIWTVPLIRSSTTSWALLLQLFISYMWSLLHNLSPSTGSCKTFAVLISTLDQKKEITAWLNFRFGELRTSALEPSLFLFLCPLLPVLSSSQFSVREIVQVHTFSHVPLAVSEKYYLPSYTHLIPGVWLINYHDLAFTCSFPNKMYGRIGGNVDLKNQLI